MTVPPLPRDSVLRHSAAEDLLALITGTYLASLGLHLLHSSDMVTGGTAGLALLISAATGMSLGALFFLVNVPFFVLALVVKGWSFTLRTALCVSFLSLLSEFQAWAIGPLDVSPWYAALGGNLLVGVGLLVLFRHGASLGGFSILALIAQERFSWRAGYVQMALDVVVVVAAFSVVSWRIGAISAVGAVVLNLVLALNHRPGRYLGGAPATPRQPARQPTETPLPTEEARATVVG